MSSSERAVQRLIYVTDLGGTAVFAFEGALIAVAAHLDLFGVLVLACCTAFGGGVIRDVLMGQLPPSALRGWVYPGTALAAGAFAFAFASSVHVPPKLLLTLDAAGLALFAIAGADKALEAGVYPLSATMLGTITAVGGGTLRDVLLAQVPGILRADIYATAALAGSAVLVICRRAGVPVTIAALGGGLTCFALRLLGVWQHWQLPGAS